MDEYDVFLDNDARNYTLNKLQAHAMDPHQQGRQFMIITPHNLLAVKQTENVRILSLLPPARISAHGLQQMPLNF